MVLVMLGKCAATDYIPSPEPHKILMKTKLNKEKWDKAGIFIAKGSTVS
jgi:hypothetical protein